MDRTGGMENAHDTLAPECTGPEARFPHRLGRHRTPPIRSTGTLVCTLEHDVTGRISSTRCETDGRKLTEQRRYAPTSVHVRRNPCSRSPDLVFTFTGLRTAASDLGRRPAVGGESTGRSTTSKPSRGTLISTLPVEPGRRYHNRPPGDAGGASGVYHVDTPGRSPKVPRDLCDLNVIRADNPVQNDIGASPEQSPTRDPTTVASATRPISNLPQSSQMIRSPRIRPPRATRYDPHFQPTTAYQRENFRPP